MTLEIFRNFEHTGSACIKNLVRAGIKPALFKANDYKHHNEKRYCIEWTLSTDKEECYFNGYVRDANSDRIQYCKTNGQFEFKEACKAMGVIIDNG